MNNKFTISLYPSDFENFWLNRQDVLRIEKESKDSYYVSPCCKISITQNSKQIVSSKTKNKALPPLSKDNTILRTQGSIDSATSNLKRLKSQNSNQYHPKKLDNTLKSYASSDSVLSLITDNKIVDNKKKSPEKIKSVEQQFSSNFNNNKPSLTGLDTPITIDILSESGRYSRQSLEPLLLSTNRYSNRASSTKELLFYKHPLSGGQLNSGKIEFKENFKRMSAKDYSNDPDGGNYEESYIDRHISDDFELEDDLNENNLLISSISASNLADSNQDLRNENAIAAESKLDTIKEASINDAMQVNIKKLHLNEKFKNETCNSNNLNNKKPSNNSKANYNTNISKSTNNKHTVIKKVDSQPKLNPTNSNGNLAINTNQAKSSNKCSVLDTCNNKNSKLTKTESSKNVFDNTKQNEKQTIVNTSTTTNNNKQIEKQTIAHSSAASNNTNTNKSPLTNMDIFDPTSNVASEQQKPNSPNTISNKTTNLKKKQPLVRKDSSNKALKDPTPLASRTNSSRIEVNKKPGNNAIATKINVKSDESTTVADLASSVNTTLTTITLDSGNATPTTTLPPAIISRKLDGNNNELKLEITSSRISLAEKPSSAQLPSSNSALSNYTHSNEMNRLLSAASKLIKLPDPSDFFDLKPGLVCGELPIKPTQPFIVTMYEDYPQPFTAQSINYISSANLQTKKAKINKKLKNNNINNNNKHRVGSGSKNVSNNKSKQKNQTSSKTKQPRATNNKLKNKKGDTELKSTETINTETINGDERSRNIHTDEDLTNQNNKSNYETDEFEAESGDSSMSDYDDDQDKSDAGKNLTDYKNDENTNEHIKEKQNLAESTSSTTKDESTKLSKNIVQSFEERVFAIYNKFDVLLNQQSTIINNNESTDKTNGNLGKTREANQKLIELNEQKAQFSDEMARELNENVNFDEISSNPELVTRLKELYKLVKQNGHENNTAVADNGLESTGKGKNNAEKQIVDKKLNDRKNNENEQRPRKNSVTFGSIKSNADIREVYTMVNSMNSNTNNNKTNSLNIKNDSNENPENTVKLTKKNSNYNSKTYLNYNTNNGNQTNKIYKLPENLSDKINDLMVPIEIAASINENKKEDTNEMTIKKGEMNESFEEPFGFDLSQVNNLKINYTNSLDSVGNELNRDYDPNSISYHYDVKYRNEGSKSPISLQIEEGSNDFQFRWKRGNLIGKGAFGSVYQAMLSTGVIIAVKQIEMEDGMDPSKARKEYDNVREEVKILRELDHINIVQFMGTMLEGNIVNIFMELIPGGTIETLLKIYGPFEESLFKNFTQQILEGVNYIHSRNVVHRDIKGRNIMLMGNGIIKLIDFGCAKRLKKNQSSNSIKQLLKSLKGTPYWMSPEVIRETGHGSKADIWSTGATIFEMATGLPPYSELAPISAIYAIGSGEAPPPTLPSKFSSEAIEFVNKCLTRSPDLRPSAAELLNHDFLKN